MKTVLSYFWHFLIVLLVLAIPTAAIGLWMGADFYYDENELAFKAGNEGPHIFQQGDHWVLQTLRGNRDEGFWIDERRHALNEPFEFDVIYPLDNSQFRVRATPEFVTPPTRYDDEHAIVAISDIEGNYRAFRDFLINANVIDRDLKWVFGKGHLVLVGDFVDRGVFVTQVLWFIYKLEQEAKLKGGHVHYILGNHEIKNLHGDFQFAHGKYFNVATALGRPQIELLGDNAFLGRWLMSKNTAEVINGTLFVHGGLHPKLAELNYTVDDLNDIVRAHYRQRWFPKRGASAEDLLLNPETGPSWYRGYFKEDLTQAQIEQALAKLNANTVVVGHTLNANVTTLFEKKVFAIDVKHPSDHRSSFPLRSSEGLRLEKKKAWRILENGQQVEL